MILSYENKNSDIKVEWLDGTKETIANICYECGFESQRTFNRVFKERYRMTPREYRTKKHLLEVY